jgi:hypothetical protein
MSLFLYAICVHLSCISLLYLWILVHRAAVLKQDYELAGHIQKKMDFELQVRAISFVTSAC